MLSSETSQKARAVSLGDLVRIWGYAGLGKTKEDLSRRTGVPVEIIRGIVNAELVHDWKFGEMSSFDRATLEKVVDGLSVPPMVREIANNLVHNLTPRGYDTRFLSREGKFIDLSTSLTPEEREALYPSTAIPSVRRIAV